LNSEGKPLDLSAWKKPSAERTRGFGHLGKKKSDLVLPSLTDIATTLHVPGFSKSTKVQEIPGESSECQDDGPHHITVELFAERDEKVPAPHRELLHDEIEVEEHDLVKSPDEELKALFRPGEGGGNERIRRIKVSAAERTVLVYGKIHNAADLVAADWLTGKSNPYVVAEAISQTGEMVFMYRTRIIKKTVNPQFNESFMFAVPPDSDFPSLPMSLSSIRFSVFDSRLERRKAEQEAEEEEEKKDDKKGKKTDKKDPNNKEDEKKAAYWATSPSAKKDRKDTEEEDVKEDELLGRCTVKIAFMRNCDRFHEDVPLLGIQARPGGYVNKGGFKRYSMICVEVRVERRVKRVVQPKRDEDDMLHVDRHRESRPEMKQNVKINYNDFSQYDASCIVPELEIASKVFNLRDHGKLVDPNRKQRGLASHHDQQNNSGWLAMRRTMARTLSESALKSRPDQKRLNDWDDLGYEDSEEDTTPLRRAWIPSLKESFQNELKRTQEDMYELAPDRTELLPPMKRTASLPALTQGTRFGHDGQRYDQLSIDPFEPNTWEAARRVQKELILPKYSKGFREFADRDKKKFDDIPDINLFKPKGRATFTGPW